MKMCEQIKKKNSRKNSGNDLEVKIHLKAIQLFIKQNVPSLNDDYRETKS